MIYNILSIPLFDKQAKRLLKKYPSFKKDLIKLTESLSDNPEQGAALGNNFYKIRLAITSKGKGKSSGAQVITYVKNNGDYCFSYFNLRQIRKSCYYR